MSRIRCYRPSSCGVTFHVAGTSAAVQCQDAVKKLPRPKGPALAMTETPKPQTQNTLIDSKGNLVMESVLIPPESGSRAVIRDRETGNTFTAEFQEGTRRIQTSNVFRWKFYRDDKPGDLRTMLWDSSNPSISPYEIVEYV